MTKFTVYSYTFTGRCIVDVVDAANKAQAKFKVLVSMGVSASNFVQRQVAEKVA